MDQVNEVTDKDIEETLKLLKEVPSHVSAVNEIVEGLLKRIKNNELNTDKGYSFFDVKNQTLLSYITNLTYIIMQKLSGNSIENDPAIERLCELRVVLEKMRPIEDMMKNQVEKLKASASGNIDTKNPLRFKANPESFENQADEDEDSEEEQTSSKVYVPPKISAAYFDESDTIDERKKKILERSQKKALNSSLLNELRREYATGPEEIRETMDKMKFNNEMNERTRYEEEYMIRLPMTKKQRHEARQFTTVTNFDTKFDDISALEMQPEDISVKRKSHGKKGKGIQNSKKKGKKRKFHRY